MPVTFLGQPVKEVNRLLVQSKSQLTSLGQPFKEVN